MKKIRQKANNADADNLQEFGGPVGAQASTPTIQKTGGRLGGNHFAVRSSHLASKDSLGDGELTAA